MKVYYANKTRNVGDTLTPKILKHFIPSLKIDRVPIDQSCKVMGVGSILESVQAGDIVWGSGLKLGEGPINQAAQANFFAVRGPLTRRILIESGASCPEIYGDPALLLPRMIAPAGEKRYKVGYIPHFVDYAAVGRVIGWNTARCLIDVFLPLQEFIEKVTSCDRIISSSLHGIVIAEAYGIPAEWAVWSRKVKGKGFKFRDYAAGTGRTITKPGKFPAILDLHDIQEGLLNSLYRLIATFDPLTSREFSHGVSIDRDTPP